MALEGGSVSYERGTPVHGRCMRSSATPMWFVGRKVYGTWTVKVVLAQSIHNSLIQHVIRFEECSLIQNVIRLTHCRARLLEEVAGFGGVL